MVPIVWIPLDNQGFHFTHLRVLYMYIYILDECVCVPTVFELPDDSLEFL